VPRTDLLLRPPYSDLRKRSEKLIRRPRRTQAPRSNSAPPGRSCASSDPPMAPGGGGFVVMLAASAVLIGSFLLSFP
jgi:hypothetical protein